MKKGILISGILTIILYSIFVLVFTIVGIVQLVAGNLAANDPGAIDTPELAVAATAFLIVAGVFLVGLIFAIILIAKRNSDMGKGAGIALGVFGLLFGAIIPGIIFIVDSAKTRS